MMNKDKNTEAPDITRITLQVLFIGILIIACGWILRPFLSSIIWAAIIVVATWPILLRLQTWFGGRRSLAVTALTGALLLVIIVPLSFAVVTIVSKADDIAVSARSLTAFRVPPAPDWVGSIPLAGPKLAERWQQFAVLGPEELTSRLAPFASNVAGWFMAQVGSAGMMLLQFLLTVIIAAIMYANGERASEGILGFSRRLAGQHGEEVTLLAAKAVRGVTLGVVVTAILQAAIGGLGLAVTGVPAYALLMVVIFMLCLAQVGPVPVLVPAVIWLFWNDGALWGSVLIVFMVLAVSLDNVVRPALIRKGVDLLMVLIFAGVTGGLFAFGIIGLFIGPVVLAVTYTLLKAWVSGNAEGKPFLSKRRQKSE